MFWKTDSIVGKGNHSPNHIQKIKPAVEQICQELGLQYSTEPNAGRMYVNLQGGAADMPSQFMAQNGGGYKPGYGGKHHGGGGGGGGQQHHGGQQHGGQQYHEGIGQAGGYQGSQTYPPMGGGQQGYPQQQQQQQGYQGAGQQQYQGGGQQQQQEDPNAEMKAEIKAGVKKYGPTAFRLFKRNCCTVM